MCGLYCPTTPRNTSRRILKFVRRLKIWAMLTFMSLFGCRVQQKALEEGGILRTWPIKAALSSPKCGRSCCGIRRNFCPDLFAPRVSSPLLAGAQYVTAFGVGWPTHGLNEKAAGRDPAAKKPRQVFDWLRASAAAAGPVPRT